MTSSIIQPSGSFQASSLIGQMSYARSTQSFTKLISQLSSGIRIDSGRDDPAGFVSSSILSTEIANMNQAIQNNQRSNEMLSVVDGALAHINSLIVELRGYVTEAANTAVESRDMIEGLQLQVDAALDTIDRIANTTSFQGQKLLDGSFGFVTYGVPENDIAKLDIYSANFNGATEKDISVKILQTANQAKLFYQYGVALESVSLQVSGLSGSYVYNFDKGASITSIADAVNMFSDVTGVAAKISTEPTHGIIGLSSAGVNNDIILTASQPGTTEGNFIVRYTAPAEGNDTLSLRYHAGTGLSPNEIEVVLQTEPYTNAVFQPEESGVTPPNSHFQLVLQIPGGRLNNLEFDIINVAGTVTPAGITADWQSVPPKITIGVSYDETDPTSPTNTTVNDLATWIDTDPVLGTYLRLEHLNYSNGTGLLLPTVQIGLSVAGKDGGAVVSTSQDVVTLLNTSPLLKDINGDSIVSAAIPTGENGLGVVSPFSEYAYYGDIATQNALQFLGPAHSPNIQFVSTPGTPLSIDDTTFPASYGRAEVTVQGLSSGTSFTLRAYSPGSDQYDGVAVIFEDSPQESAILDPSRGAIVISVDFTGRAADPNRDYFNMNDLQEMVLRDPFLGSRFEFIPLTHYDRANPPQFDATGYIGIDSHVGTVTGGLHQQATLVVHLETDSSGKIKTTANDLVAFFDNQYETDAQAVLQKYGISASVMNLSNAAVNGCVLDPSLNGFGLLVPTTTLDVCDPVYVDGPYKEIQFTSYGLGTVEDFPSVVVESQNGLAASFVVSAQQKGWQYDGTSVRIVTDTTGPNVQYLATSQTLLIGIDPSNPPTANDIINLINTDPNTSGLFSAARAPFSDGTGQVATGDQGLLSGGVRKYTAQAQGITTAQSGIDGVFQVTAVTADSKYAGTTVRVIAADSGPNVVYDPQTKELAIGLPAGMQLTAKEMVDLINQTPNINELFIASIPLRIPGTLIVSSGTGIVTIGDVGMMKTPETGSPLGAPMTGNSDNQQTGLMFYSTEYGSAAFVSVATLGQSNFPVQTMYGFATNRTTGTDVVALIDGEQAIGIGNTALVRTSDLDIAITMEGNVKKGSVLEFRITSGGALIQMGPNASTLEQARISLPDVHVAKLGGIAGVLADIHSSGRFNLRTDTKMAFQIVEEVGVQISSLRGRIGAFQKTQLETGISQLSDLEGIATSARSAIRDTDFAAAASELSRLQVLMETNISVLQRNIETSRLALSLLQS